ncbi:DUF2290 domain-containing protein [Rhodoferax antarcticus]|uniref:DUF2290 domain-containing protein n=1 Tax=Rhodoferax antarcticus TaxID=81479 RepID=UPI002224EF8E|nr:DUF2290 domain-containing protein [Rhodoferax antarcticus]MCW2312213.1 hypothetical protein [Rhodoferax antarcticus]
MTPEIVEGQLKDVFKRMIGSGLSVKQFYPKKNNLPNGRLSFGDLASASIAMKNVAYDTIFTELDQNESYHIRLPDGGLLIFQYTFERTGALCKHRLAFFPSPRLPTIEEAPHLYENDELYGDILLNRIVRFPIRFDFDPDNHRDVLHPISHLTLGQFDNCRVPIVSAVPPNSFLMFVLRNFYYRSYTRHKNRFDKSMPYYRLVATITKDERRISHLHMV